MRNSFHYAALHLASIAETARDVDFYARWGFGMKQGPFELWQEAGWLEVAHDPGGHRSGQGALCRAPLPGLLFNGPAADAGGVHQPQGSLEPDHAQVRAKRVLPVCAPAFPRDGTRQSAQSFATAGKTLHEDDAIRLWTLDDQVVIASIKTKMHAISPDVAEGLQRRWTLAEQDYQGVVIWSGDEPFSAGPTCRPCCRPMAVGVSAIDEAEHHLQQTMLRLRYASVPVVSAIRGLALGGGCEVAVHSARRVAPWRATSAWLKRALAWCRGRRADAHSRAAPLKTRCLHRQATF